LKSSKNNVLESYKSGKLQEGNINMDETKDKSDAMDKIKALIVDIAFESVVEINDDFFR